MLILASYPWLASFPKCYKLANEVCPTDLDISPSFSIRRILPLHYDPSRIYPVLIQSHQGSSLISFISTFHVSTRFMHEHMKAPSRKSASRDKLASAYCDHQEIFHLFRASGHVLSYVTGLREITHLHTPQVQSIAIFKTSTWSKYCWILRREW